MKLFPPEGSAEGCASGECLPEAAATATHAGSELARAATSSASPGSAAAPTPAHAGAPPANRTMGSPALSGSPRAAAGTPGPAVTSPLRPSPAAPTSAASAPPPGARAPIDDPAPLPGDEDDELGASATSPSGNGEHERWRRAVDAVRAALPRHGKSLSYARFLGFSPDGVRIAFPPDAAFHRTQVVGMSRPLLEAELTKSLGRPGKLVEEAFDAQAFAAAPKSIAEVEANDRATREKQIEAHVRAHPAVRGVLRHLGGGIEHIQYLEPVPKDTSTATPEEGEPPGSD